MNSGLTLSSIHVYPVKGAAGISISEAEVDAFGLRFDRRWMWVREDGRFISQRSHRRMALVETGLENGSLVLRAPAMEPLHLPLGALDEECSGEEPVVIWNDQVSAVSASPEAHKWISTFLEEPIRMVFIPQNEVRSTDPDYAQGYRVGFADGYPFLMVSEASLAELNGRLEAPVPMDRFRPNLVVAGGEAFQEDQWGPVTVGEVPFRGVKLCGRCKVTTVDQRTAEQGVEPLQTLATYRTAGGKVVFGQNLVQLETGMVRVGDAVLPGLAETFRDPDR